jgi:phosphotriesterase-related protein
MNHPSGAVQGVLGPIAGDALGVTLRHEHVFVRNPSFVEPDAMTAGTRGDEPVRLDNLGWIRWNWTSNRDNLILNDEEAAVVDLTRYRAAGGVTIVDPTLRGIGRDAAALQRVARRTGLNLVMGCGYYVAETHPAGLAGRPPESIAEDLLGDLREGVDGTDARAGFIGEIGCAWPMRDAERLVLRAAAIAQRQTGVALMVHPGRNRAAPFEIVEVLRAEGIDLSRVILAHLDRTVTDLDGLRALAADGLWLAFDNVGLEPSHYPFPVPGIDTLSDAQRLDLLARCLDAGLGDRILLSQDICTKHRLARFGGHGYDHLLTNIRPWMRRRGFGLPDIERIFVGNPARMLTGT